jgi:hypothetical protein
MPPSKRKLANQKDVSNTAHVQRARAVREQGEHASSSATSMDVDATLLRARVCSR